VNGVADPSVDYFRIDVVSAGGWLSKGTIRIADVPRFQVVATFQCLQGRQ
jgi:hypothetical protein